MPDWEITATTIYCDAVDDEVTFLLSRDGAARCTGYGKYGKPDKETARVLGKKSKKLGKRLACDGVDCPRVARYRDGLLSNEKVTK